MDPINLDRRASLEKAVRRGLRHEGHFGDDCDTFAYFTATLWELFRIRVPDGLALAVFIGPYKPDLPSGTYAIVRACCVEAYADAAQIPLEEIPSLVARLCSNALEAAADKHAEGGPCSRRG